MRVAADRSPGDTAAVKLQGEVAAGVLGVLPGGVRGDAGRLAFHNTRAAASPS